MTVEPDWTHGEGVPLAPKVRGSAVPMVAFTLKFVEAPKNPNVDANAMAVSEVTSLARKQTRRTTPAPFPPAPGNSADGALGW